MRPDRPCPYGDPACTGRHKNGSGMCPSALARKRKTARESQRHYRMTAAGILSDVRTAAKQRGSR